MKNQVKFLAFKAKKQLEKLKYLEINIKSFCSTYNMFNHDDFRRDNCDDNNRAIPNFYEFTLQIIVLLVLTQSKQLLA